MSTTTFHETQHPRSTDGTFAEKPQTAPEAVLPPAASVHPDNVAARSTHRRERHDELSAEGALASSYDNVHLMDFEDEFGEEPDEATMFSGIETIGAGWDPEEDYFSEDIARERSLAVGELSRRIAQGQDGELRDATKLNPGDRIDLARLSEDAYDDNAEFPPAPDYATVITRDTAAGEVFLHTDGGLAVLPEGVLIPVVES